MALDLTATAPATFFFGGGGAEEGVSEGEGSKELYDTSSCNQSELLV